MYGLIQQGLKDLVMRSCGPEAWIQICKVAQCEVTEFESLAQYPDSLTLSIVAATAQQLSLSQDELLRRFGKHWITFTAQDGYGPLLQLFGATFKSCLTNLNRMHGHFGTLMPNLKPPRFIVEEVNDARMTLHYYSTRKGLAHMVFGLLEGLAGRFGERVDIAHIPSGTRSDHDEFDLVFIGA